MNKPLPARQWPGSVYAKCLLGLGVAAAAIMGPGSAHAFKDPLEVPAMMAPKAAKTLALNLTARGSKVLMVGSFGIILQRDFDAPAAEGGVPDREGNVWQQAKVPVSVNLTGVVQVNDTLAFAVGHDGVVLKSTDAGASWVKVFDGNQANEQVVAAAQKRLDDAQARLDAYADSLPANPSSQQAEKLAELELALETAQFGFEDAEAGARFGPARPMLDVWFKDENTGWVVGSYGQIFETNDGGNTWVLIADRLQNDDFRHYNGLYGDQTGLLLIAGESGRIYRSRDFGANWERMETGYIGHFYGTVVVPSPQGGEPTILAYGFGGNVYRLGPGASQWWQLKSPTRESLVQGINVGNKALFIDQKGKLIETDDSGTQLRLVSREEGRAVTGMVQVGNTLVLSGQGGPLTMPMPK